MLSSPRIVCQHRPDSSSLESLLNFSQFRNKTNENLVLAIYNYYTSQSDGFYHFWPSCEKHAFPQKRTSIGDSIKLLNVYGWTICGQNASFLNNLYHKAGLQSRIFSIPGHVLCEVNYNDSWHVLDVDMWTWFKKANREIASAFELATQADELILKNKNTSQPCNLPDRDLESYAKLYKQAKTVEDELQSIFPDGKEFGFTISYHLRPGEKITRMEKEAGRFHLPLEWLKNIKEGSKEWQQKPCERFSPFRSYGNGIIDYNPNLSSESNDLKFSDWKINGLKQTETGLLGIGRCQLNLRSPFPFSGIPKIENEHVNYIDGAKLRLKGHGQIRIEYININGAFVQKETLTGNFDECVDFTEELQGQYFLAIKLVFLDKSLLEKFHFTGYFQHAPITMPKILTGQNKMALKAGDKHNFHTQAHRLIVDFRTIKGLNKHLVTVENGYLDKDSNGWFKISPEQDTSPCISIFCIKSANPTKWFTCFATIKEEKKDLWGQIEWSHNKKDWHLLTKEEFIMSRMAWDVHINTENTFEKALKKIYLKITSNCSLSELEYTGHETIKNNCKRLLIKHEWEENGIKKEHSVDLKRQTEYCVQVNEEPKNHMVTIESPSLKEDKTSQGQTSSFLEKSILIS